jgi:hypothetical protein
MPKKTKRDAYGASGTQMEVWLTQFDTAGCEPLIHELCTTSDRLAEIRAELAKPGLKTMDRCHLISAENRVQGMLMRIWRQSGLGDDTAPKFGRPGDDDED